MVGFGAGLLTLDRRLPRAFSAGGTAAIIGAILPAYMIILLRGSLLQASGGLFVMIAGMVLLGAGSNKVTAAQPFEPFGRGPDRRDYGRYSPLRSASTVGATESPDRRI